MRLFIAINLPEETKNMIEEAVNKVQPLFSGYPARFLSRENWHLTVTFLGYQPPEALVLIQKSIKETTARFNPIKIDFESVSYGPPDKPARMVWLVGARKTSEELSGLKINLEKALIEKGIKFQQENRPFSAHLTLVRFSGILGGLPDKLITPLSLSFEAKTLDLMESHLKRSGAEYEKISQFDFR